MPGPQAQVRVIPSMARWPSRMRPASPISMPCGRGPRTDDRGVMQKRRPECQVASSNLQHNPSGAIDAATHMLGSASSASAANPPPRGPLQGNGAPTGGFKGTYAENGLKSALWGRAAIVDDDTNLSRSNGRTDGIGTPIAGSSCGLVSAVSLRPGPQRDL